MLALLLQPWRFGVGLGGVLRPALAAAAREADAAAVAEACAAAYRPPGAPPAADQASTSNRGLHGYAYDDETQAKDVRSCGG
jgi:hypothetical protein